MADKETVIRITLDQAGAVRGYEQLGRASEDARGGAERLGQATSTLGSLLSGVGAGIAGGLTLQLSRLPSAFASVIESGAKIDDISESFDRLSQKAGVSSDALINKFSSALSNTIPKVDLMKQANELMLGGINPSKFELIAQAARKFGEVTGGSAKDGMDALTDSLLRGNDRALKTIGIVVDNKKAADDFAKSLGTTGDKLNEVGRVEANRIAVLKALEDQSSKLNNVTDDAGDKVDQLKTAWRNEWDQVERNIANNKTLLGLLDSSIRLLNGLVLTVEDVTKSLSLQDKTFNDGAKAIAQWAKNFALSGGAVNDLKLAVTQVAAAQVEQQSKTLLGTAALIGMEAAATKTSAAHKTLSKGVTENKNNYIDFSKGAGEAKKALDDLNEANNKNYQEIQRLTGTGGISDLSARMGELIKSQLDGKISSEDLATALLDLQTKFSSTKDAAGLYGTALKDGVKAANDSLQDEIAILDALSDSWAKADRDATKAAEDLEKALSSALAGALKSLGDAALNGASSQDLKKIGEQLGAGMGSAAGAALATSIGAPGLAPVFSEIGSVLGESLVKGIETFWGSDNAGTKFRKSVDKFFADAFDANRLQVIIGGQLQNISDLNFGGNNFGNATAGFFDAFNNLPAAAQAAFDGVAQGFTGLLGQGEEFASGLAAVLTNNVGGSLNNLQLLVEASGKSFEQLRDQVVEAFLDGKLSALQAQTALNGLAQVAQKGIPDALGAVDTAFKNLEASGSKGGRALIDALQDIGFEAKELGIKDFAGLEAELKKRMPSAAAAIEQVFNTLQQNGVGTIEQLTTATAEGLLPVLSQLQAQNFPFAEAAKDVDSLVQSINELPSQKSITIDIKTRISSQDQDNLNAVIQAGGGFSNNRSAGFAT